MLCRAQDGYCTSHHRQGDICGSGHNQLQSCEMCTSAWQRYGLRSILHGTGHNQDFGLEDQRPTSYPQIVFSLELGKVKVEMKCFPWQSQCAVSPLAFVFDFLLLQGFASLVSKPSSALQHHLQECHSLQRCHNEGRSSCCQTCTCQTWLDRGKALGACLGSSFHSWQQGRQFRSGSGDKFDQTCNAQSCGIFSKCVLHLPFWTFYLNLEFSDSAQTTSSSSHLHDKKTIQ